MKELLSNKFIIGCVLISLACVGVQHYIKKKLILRQYGYFKDIILVGAWLILALWFGDFHERVLICGSVLACFAGIAEYIYRDSKWRLFYPVIGFLCAYFGASVHFIRFPDNEYIYLTPTFALIASTVWFSFFPFIFRYLDEIPGLLGHVLAVTFILMLSAGIATGAGIDFMPFAGLTLVIAFWSRFGNVYRQAGIALSSMWGLLVAGTAIIGNSKGIVLSTILFLSLGMFAIPSLEIFFNFICDLIFDTDTQDNKNMYSNMLSSGVEHPEAVQSLAGLCALTSIAAAWEQWLAALIIILAVMIFRRINRRKNNNMRPSLWGINFDNVSMNYAVSKARSLISNPESENAQLIVTLNALGMEAVLRDKEFCEAVKNSAMTLPDGAGLCLGLKILGTPVQERVAGIDFAEQLCRLASVEGWPVYLAGAAGNTAVKCAEILKERFPGLKIAGARDGYFDINDEKIPLAISESGAKILLAAMGQPRQEKWIYKHREIFGSLLCVGVGGAFDVISGKLNRAPKWIQKIGFEWLYRQIQEPQRWRNNLGLIAFMLRIFAAKIGLYRKKIQ